MLDKAIAITADAFEGVFDKGGTPYILHCLTVMYGVKTLGTIAMEAAVMHDLIEDTYWTLDSLRLECFSEEVLSIIEKLTHKDIDTYEVYIKKISACPIATAIKLADLDHNSDIHRMKGLSAKDFERLAKYHKAYAFLTKEIK